MGLRLAAIPTFSLALPPSPLILPLDRSSTVLHPSQQPSFTVATSPFFTFASHASTFYFLQSLIQHSYHVRSLPVLNTPSSTHIRSLFHLLIFILSSRDSAEAFLIYPNHFQPHASSPLLTSVNMFSKAIITLAALAVAQVALAQPYCLLTAVK